VPKKKDEFDTTEIICASWLALRLNTLPRFDWSGPQCYFVFDKTKELEEELATFMTGEAIENVREYHNQFVKVRQGMFASQPRSRV
jgi:hypothetical protein